MAVLILLYMLISILQREPATNPSSGNRNEGKTARQSAPGSPDVPGKDRREGSHRRDAIPSKKAIVPAEEPILLSVSDAEKLGKMSFLKDNLNPKIDPDFATLFKMTPQQVSSSEEALKKAMAQLNEIEYKNITNIERKGKVLTFEIPYFEKEGELVKSSLYGELKETLPSQAYAFLRKNEERFFKYEMADFGKFKRNFEIIPLQDDPHGKKWEVKEHNFIRAAEWAIKEGRPADVDYGTRIHRFDSVPGRFENLLAPK